jgi:hypothetical protein
MARIMSYMVATRRRARTMNGLGEKQASRAVAG